LYSFLGIMLFVTTAGFGYQQLNFSGTWIRNDKKCVVDNDLAPNSIPVKLVVTQSNNQFDIIRSIANKGGDTTVYKEKLSLNGAPASSVIPPALNKKSTLVWKSGSSELLQSATYSDSEGNIVQKNDGTWTLLDGGKTLQIKTVVKKGDITYNWTGVFEKK